MDGKVMEDAFLYLIPSLEIWDDLVFSPQFLCCLVIAFLFVWQVLKLFSIPVFPELNFKSDDPTNRIQKVIQRCQILHEKYVPPWLAGRNGHLQTAAYGLLGRAQFVKLSHTRYWLPMKDGAQVTFDVFDPQRRHPKGDYTLALCPGIANSSESSYIRTCVNFAQLAGYRCAVLNHIGAVKSIPLASNRIFNYGSTDEYRSMLMKLAQLYPQTKFLIIGFSMGANIVTKYLGENPELLERVVCGMSICQGYDAIKACPIMHQWRSFRRLYLYIMTENMKHLLRTHHDQAVLPHVKSGLIDERELWASTSLYTFDDAYSRKLAGFSTVEEYYQWCSCKKSMNKINIPMLYLNAADDPLIPDELLIPAREAATTKSDCLFVLTRHGGHLGFLEGSTFSSSFSIAHEVTWLDRFIVQFADAMVSVYDS